MRNFLFAGVAAFLMILAGCNVIAKKIYGIRSPRVESEASIRAFLLKHKLDTADVVAVAGSEWAGVMNSTGIPECAFYDSRGRYIEYRLPDTSCNAAAFGFVEHLDKNSSYPMPDSLPMVQQLAKLRDLNGNKVPMPGAADFYLLIYWGVFAGKLNEDHVKVWEDMAKANRKCSIKVIKVSLDGQEFWSENEKARLR